MTQMNDAEALSFLSKRVDPTGVAPQRHRLEDLWTDTVAWYSSIQRYVRGRRGNLRLPREPQRMRGRIRYQLNLIKPNVLRNVSKMLQLNVTYEVLPRNQDIDNILAAEAGGKYYQWRRQSPENQVAMFEVLLWTAITGTAFTKLSWDPTAGDKLRIFTEPKFSVLPGGQRSRGGAAPPTLTEAERRAKEAAGQFEDTAPGAPQLDALSPFELIVDPRARFKGMTQADWAVHRKLMLRSAATELYPFAEKQIEEAQSYNFASGGIYFLELISQFTGGQEGLYSQGIADYEKSDLVLVDELWGRPGKQFGDQGSRMIRVGSELISNEINPYAEAGIGLPFVAWRWQPNPGQLWGGGLVAEMMPAQDAYNEDRSRVREQFRRHGNPRMLAPRNSGVKEADFNESPSNLIYYNTAGGAPTPMPAPEVPQYALAEIGRAKQEIDEVSATSGLDRGEGPGSVRGTIGVRLLLDRSEEIRDPTILNHMLSVQELGQMELRLANRFMKDDRLLTILGEGGEREMLAFTGADLRNNTALFITSQPGQRDTQISRVSDVDFLLEREILNPANPADKAAILKTLRFKVPNDEYSVETTEELDEKSVIQQMVKNPTFTPMPEPWELPEPRLRAINDFRRKRDMWQALADATRARISARADVFQTTLQEQQLRAQMLAAQLQSGSPAPKGEASQPKASGSSSEQVA